MTARCIATTSACGHWESEERMVYRVFTEKREGLRQEAETLAEDIRSFLGIPELTGIRILNRYDVEGITPELMEICKTTVFSEPPIDILTETLHHDAPRSLITEYLPGQFDQRADSAAQCIQLISRGEKPHVRTARVYLLYGELTDGQYETICRYLINPVESRRATEALPETLDIPVIRPEAVPVLTGFTTMDGEALGEFVKRYGLAMDDADLKCCRDYFIGEKRDPTLTEVRVLDTYWSDHCRHTTFGTHLEEVEIREPAAQAAYARYLALRRELGIRKPVTLMDIATIGAKALRARGKLENAVISGETNACTVRIKADADGREEDWLLLFKNETHNHPTEIEPFGGAATCIGGAIRDPLSGRAYVYQAMRITGAADPLAPAEETLPGKIPQRKLTTTAARGFSSYGNQVGVATGLAEEIYHPGYEAKRMELGAVIAAVPADHVRQEEPAPGDLVILLGGRTGRDGCGGATGSSKPHHMASVEECSAEVQKGNAPEERKLQRLFRDPEVTRRIKRCNDFGAGGVSVAIGELADGLRIDLDKVPLKYEGLDGTELAISESQERMAVVIAPEDAAGFIEKAYKENVEATPVAVVTAEKRLVMTWRGQRIVDISRAFLDTNGASRSKSALVEKAKEAEKGERPEGTAERWQRLAEDLNVCSQRGMAEHFDSTIGAGSVLMPFGGKYQRTPAQVMAAKIPLERGETHTCTVMAWGYDPVLTKRNPYAGAYRAVAESAAKLVASGAGLEESYFTFQEYFERLGNEPSRWGKPLAALLGALDAQMDLGIGSIGGKDSMSGSFEDMDVPPTLVSFGVSVSRTERILSPEFKRAGSAVTLLPIECAGDVPVKEAMLEAFRQVTGWIREGKLLSASAVTRGGGAAAILKACFGNRVGFKTAEGIPEEILFADMPGFVLEWKSAPEGGMLAGRTESAYTISAGEKPSALPGWRKSGRGSWNRYSPDMSTRERTRCPPSPMTGGTPAGRRGRRPRRAC